MRGLSEEWRSWKIIPIRLPRSLRLLASSRLSMCCPARRISSVVISPGGSSNPITAPPTLDLPARRSSQVIFSRRLCRVAGARTGRESEPPCLPAGRKSIVCCSATTSEPHRRTSVRTGLDANQPRRRSRLDVRHFMTLRKAVGSGWYADRSHPDGARPGAGIGRQTCPRYANCAGGK